MKSFTVVVLYPDRFSDIVGGTYIAMVQAKDAESALRFAQREAMTSQPSSRRGTLEEWVPIVAFEGNLTPIWPGRVKYKGENQ